MHRWLAGVLLGALTVGLAIAQDTGLPADSPPEDTQPPESLLADTGDSGDTTPVDPMDSQPTPIDDSQMPPEDTGDTAVEPEGDPCEDLGLFAGDLVISSQRALDEFGLEYNAIRGDLRVIGGEIQDISALDCLVSVEGSFTLSAQPEQAPLDRLERVTGALRVVQTPLAELSLPALVEAGSLEVEATPGLARISAPSLNRLDALVLTEDPKLSTLELPPLSLSEGLAISRTALTRPPVVTSATSIALEDNPALSSLEPLSSIVWTSELVLAGNPRLRSLAGLGQLAVVQGELFLRSNGLVDLAELRSLIVAGNVSVLDHPNLTGLGMPSLTVTKELRVVRNALQASLDLPELTRLDRLVVGECPALVELLLPSLLRSSLELRGLRSLETLDGLSALVLADEVVLTGNERLDDVTALHGTQISTLTVEDNRKLRSREVDALRDATQVPD